MGIVFTRLFSSLSGNREARILVLGLDNAGKTTILCKSRPARLAPFPSPNLRGSAPDLRRPSVWVPDSDPLLYFGSSSQIGCRWGRSSPRSQVSFGSDLPTLPAHFSCWVGVGGRDVMACVCIAPAIGFNVETVQYNNIKFQVWDLGELLRSCYSLPPD